MPSSLDRLVDPNGEQEVPIPPLQDSHVTRRSTTNRRRTGSTPPRVPPPAPDPVAARNTTPEALRRPPPKTDEVQASIGYEGGLNHTNDGSVIERR